MIKIQCTLIAYFMNKIIYVNVISNILSVFALLFKKNFDLIHLNKLRGTSCTLTIFHARPQ